jgi:hypothetical protein
MAEHVAWRIRETSPRRRISLVIPLPSLAAVASATWMIGTPLVLAALGALVATQVQKPAFRAKTEILIVARPDMLPSPWSMAPHVKIARSRALAGRVVAAARVPGLTPTQFLQHSTAKPEPQLDILNLSVAYSKAAAARRLANVYSFQLVRYENELTTASIKRALGLIERRLNALLAQGQGGSPLYQALVEQQLRLETLGAPADKIAAAVVRRADSASAFRPYVRRNGILGGVFGGLLGVALVVAAVAYRSRNRPPSGE